MKKIILIIFVFIIIVLTTTYFIVFNQSKETVGENINNTSKSDYNIFGGDGNVTTPNEQRPSDNKLVEVTNRGDLTLSDGSVLNTSWRAPREPELYKDGSTDTLSGGEDQGYVISYRAPGKSGEQDEFNIYLNKEPLSSNRLLAEESLVNKLSVPKEILCKLNISVYTFKWVSEKYSERALGLSFCPGAVLLP